MATQEKTWNVANRLHSLKDSDNPEVNHIIAGADDIYDDAKGAKQSDINAQADAALADRYTKAETYSKEQLDSLITTPDVNYVSVVATNATTAVTDVLPATGEANTIYRVGNWNGTHYDPTMYALFAWNGSTYVCLAVRSFVGEVYDISVNHPDGQGNPTPYTNLTAALGTNGANIPADIRRGGMSIKFIQGTVQSSDNKYVQHRCMAQNFTTNVTQWQGVDDEPTAGSENFVKSGGTYKEFLDTQDWFTIKARGLRKSGVVITTANTMKITPLLPVNKNYPISIKECYSGGNSYDYAPIVFYNAAEEPILPAPAFDEERVYATIPLTDIPQEAVYFRCGALIGSDAEVSFGILQTTYNNLFETRSLLDKYTPKVDFIEDCFAQNILEKYSIQEGYYKGNRTTLEFVETYKYRSVLVTNITDVFEIEARFAFDATAIIQYIIFYDANNNTLSTYSDSANQVFTCGVPQNTAKIAFNFGESGSYSPTTTYAKLIKKSDISIILDLSTQIDSLQRSTIGTIKKIQKSTTQNRGMVYIDQADQVTETNFKINITTEKPENPTSYRLYKCTAGHESLTLIGTFSFGKDVDVTRDSNLPSLYIYIPGTNTTVTKYNIFVEYKEVDYLGSRIEFLEDNYSLKDKTIVCFGDSITEFYGTSGKRYSDILSDISGATTINVGVGGTRLQQREAPVTNPTGSQEAYAALDIVNMVKAACEQDFTKQVNAAEWLKNNYSHDYTQVVTALSSIDWSKVDIVTIFGGTNDWTGTDATHVGVSGSTDVNTTLGALNYMLQLLQYTYPHVVVYYITPLIRYRSSKFTKFTEEHSFAVGDYTLHGGRMYEFTNAHTGAWNASDVQMLSMTELLNISSDVVKDVEDTSGEETVRLYTLKEFSEILNSEAVSNHVKVLDLYNEAWSAANYTNALTDDLTHPLAGMGEIAKLIKNFLS